MPVTLPRIIDEFAGAPSVSAGEIGMATGVFGSTGDSREIVPSLPPPAPVPQNPAGVAERKVYRIGGQVLEAQILTRVMPVYPPLARAARISGTVELLGVIDRQGRVQKLQVISGHPLLAQAALNAVQQWIYRPTQLNGEAVEVTAPIKVTFSLSN